MSTAESHHGQPHVGHSSSPAVSPTYNAPGVAEHAQIVDLVELYFEIVYPIFPLFHQPSFTRRIARAEYATDRSLFAVTMAICALLAARVRDGAVVSNPHWNTKDLETPAPHVYYNQAVSLVRTITAGSDINVPRTYAILALAAIQDGQPRGMHEHLGHYHTIVAMDSLHDEDNWPAGIGIVETEERRRLFWSVYTLDVFTSIVWGGVIRSREAQTNVSYPTEVDDDMFDDTGHPNESLGAQGVSWLAGRNFVIDLYRGIERLATHWPARPRAQRNILLEDSLYRRASISQDSVHSSMMQMYAELPACLKEVKPISFKPRLDRFGFQAADIIATLQLLRMVLLSNTGGSVADRCRITNEVVTAFISIPTAYHHAISVPLLWHLGMIGQLVGTTLEQRISENDYRNIREVLLSMVELLSSLEGLHATKGASERLRIQIARMDDYMVSQRQDGAMPVALPDYSTVEAAAGRSTNVALPTQAPTALDQTLTPFDLPSELLGDFSNIFDFTSWA